MPEVFELLQQAAERGEILKAEQQVGIDGSRPGAWQYLPVHAMTGPEYLLRGDPVNYVKTMEEAIFALNSIGSNTDEVATAKLKATVTKVYAAEKGLQKLSLIRQAAAEFFLPQNLSGVARWVALIRNRHYQTIPYPVAADGNCLINQQNGARVGPPHLASPASEVLAITCAA